MRLAAIPPSAGENKAAWIFSGSAKSGDACPFLPAQYCSTMEIEAEPHPSLTCGTKGTSIQMAGASAARESAAHAAETSNRPKMTRNFMTSANGDNNQDQGQNCQD